MNDLARAMRRVEKKIVRAVAFRLYGLESYSRTSGESTPPAVCQRCKSAAIPTAPRGRLFKQLLKGGNSIVGSGWSSLSKPSGDFLGKVAELPRPTSNRGLLEHERRESGFLRTNFVCQSNGGRQSTRDLGGGWIRATTFEGTLQGGGVGWGGWDDNVHVPMHTQAQQPHHLSCCWAETGTALSWSVTVGWGELIRFMFLCLHTHSNLIIFLAVEHLHTLLFHDQLPVGWGGWGGGTKVRRAWSPLEAPLKPPWSPSQAPLKPFSSPLEAPLKPFSSPLQAPLKPPSPWSPLQALLKPPSSPLEALLKPPWSPLQASYLQAPLKPFSSPLEAPLKPFSSPLQAPLKPPSPWSPLQALLKPPWSPLEAFSSPLEAPFKQATFKPSWSPSQAPLKPFSSPLEATLNGSQAPQASFKPFWSPSPAP